MSFHLLTYFCENKSKFKQMMLSSVTDWARKICQQTTLTITALLISYWYLITTLTKIIKEKDSRLGAFAKPVWSHNDVFCTAQNASHAICYHIRRVSNPYQYVCQLSVNQDHSHSHSVMWCHSASQLFLTASMYHDWCQSWCLENPSLQVGLQSSLQQKQTNELHGMARPQLRQFIIHLSQHTLRFDTKQAHVGLW